MKRYQNPDLFERLAFSYALGTLQGKARQRFEHLMAKHFYLRALVDSYQQRLAPLDESLTPINPSPQVWANISKALGFSTPKSSWFSTLWRHITQSPVLPWSLTSFSLMLAIGSLWFTLHNPAAGAYMAAMRSPAKPDALVIASVSGQAMQINFMIPQNAIPSNMQGMTPTVWCLHKDKNRPPIRMGVLNMQKENTLSLNKRMWQEMETISDFVISLEKDSATNTPTGEIAFKGQLVRL